MKDKKVTQESLILEHLRKGNVITNDSAIQLFRCYRLSDRIHRLRRKGHLIKTDMVLNDGVYHAEYTLRGEEE